MLLMEIVEVAMVEVVAVRDGGGGGESGDSGRDGSLDRDVRETGTERADGWRREAKASAP